VEGQVTWPQAVWVVGVVGASAIAGFLIAWRFWIVRSRDITQCEEKVTELEGLLNIKIAALESSVEARLSAIELFNAGTVVTLEHIKTFREEVQAQYERLRVERKQDMQALHQRLDAIFNTTQMIKLREKNG
jgi:biopolymer transport protein ExbB/TolQ